MLRAPVAILALLVASTVVAAKVVDKNATIAGLTFSYKVILPKDYDSEKAYPAILAFPPGGQTMDMVSVTLNQNWAGEAQRRGYIVVIPSAPGGRLFFEEGARVFPQFIDQILGDYKIRDNKLHIARCRSLQNKDRLGHRLSRLSAGCHRSARGRARRNVYQYARGRTRHRLAGGHATAGFPVPR